MRRRSFLWQIFPPVLLIVALSLVATGLFASRTLSHFYLDRTRADLEARAVLLGDLVQDRLDPTHATALREEVRALGRRTSTRFTVIAPDGTVLADSEVDAAAMDNHANRPEIHAALSGALGSSLRYSQTLSADLMYVALPLANTNGSVSAVVRAAVPLTAIDGALRAIYQRTMFAGIAIIALAGVVVLWLTRRISQPLVVLRDTAERFAAGDLKARPPQFQSLEISELSASLVGMAGQLADRIDALSRHTGEQERVLSSMVEGVLAIDNAGNITTLNHAAAAVLGVPPGPKMLGRSMEEVVRNPDILRFIAQVTDAGAARETELVLHGVEVRTIHARGAPILTPRGEQLGAVIVLDDVTHLERLESVRKDFVANVSHELKTPITSIKASVETLLDAGVDDEVTARRFLEIIARQADRLAAIVEDLLSLSRIETEAEGGGIVLEEAGVREVIVTAVDACRVAAEAKRIVIAVECADDIRAKLDLGVMERAVVNLIDNAIKYSDEGATVEVRGERRDGAVAISVCDHGCGIAEPHLDRLFERFYRVDKARSRALGGTGLGLAIVKHAVHAHGGKVQVESTPGRGSLFTIVLETNDILTSR